MERSTLTIMYHYIKKEGDSGRDYHFLEYDMFLRQLEHFKDKIIKSKEQFLDIMSKKCNTDGLVLLTFDDGLKDHYNNVFPALKERGLWGIFAVSSGPLKDGNILTVHKIHYLMGKLGMETFYNTTRDIVEKYSLCYENAFDLERYGFELRNRGIDNVREGKLKFLLNRRLSIKNKEMVVNEIYNKFCVENEIDFSSYYMSLDNIKEMEKEGFMISSHTITHPALNNLNKREQEKEIMEPFKFFKENGLEMKEKVFCVPYGTDAYYNQQTLKILEKNDVLCNFVVDCKEFSWYNDSKYEISRHDCNRFKWV